MNANLRTTFEKIIHRAGLTVWPKLFHSMRASCETDPMQNHPIHALTAWIGNAPKIALGHYLQTLDADFAKAVKSGAESGALGLQKAAQTGANAKRLDRTTSRETPVVEASGAILSDPVL
ncbi:MAG: hypothetical protein ACKODX_21985 [Gemmata sp.]